MRETDRLQPLLILTGLKIAVAVVILVAVLSGPDGGLRSGLLLAQIAALSASGMLLVVGGRHDHRAVHLGYVCLLLAAAFTPKDTSLLQTAEPAWSKVLFAVAQLRLEVFLAPLLGLFVRDFPAVPLSFRVQSWVNRCLRLSWLLAVGLLAANLFWMLSWLASSFDAAEARDPFYLPSILAVGACALTSLVFLGWKAYRSAGDEGRRVRFFILAVAGGALFTVAALVRLLPGDAGIEVDATLRLMALLAVNAVLVAIPFAIAYAVLVERILDVRGIARKAVQHTLTRSTARLLVAAPFAFLAVYLYRHRDVAVADLFSASHLLLPMVVLLGYLGLRYRRQLLDAVDRYFFPEQYNARNILDQLPEQLRSAMDLEQLAGRIARGVGLAWQLDRVRLLVRNPGSDLLADIRNELPPLEIESELAQSLIESREPVESDLGLESSPLRCLPEQERHWLVDGQVRLLAPTFATDGTLNGVIVLGPKRGEIPYLTEDLRLMKTIASAAGLIVEILELRNGAARNAPVSSWGKPAGLVGVMGHGVLASSDKASECVSCGSVYPAGTQTCRKCDQELVESLVPYALRKMFRFEERIGIGGMAVVYRATDLQLGRSVAIKTLPRVSPEAAVHLQQEARTAATVSHRGLAAIYGIETWEGTPMLILEFLEGGTLSARLADGPLSLAEVVETGQIVAQALEVIHTFGILHRDVKPSNVGYTRHGDAKLLDFGIARIYQDLRKDDEDPSEILTIDGRALQQSDNVTGTLCYFSPEALDDAPPDPTFDLWSLTVVLYEALTARNLFYRPRLKDMLRAIRDADVPDPRSEVPDCPAELAEFFHIELHPDKSRRSQTGQEFYQRLEKARRALGAIPQPTPTPPARPLVDVASS